VVLAIGSHKTTFDCAAGLTGAVATGPIPWGTYDTATASLVYTDPTSGVVTVEDQQTLAAVEIDAGATTDLPAVVFTVTPTTGTISFTWSLASPDAGGPAPRACVAGENFTVGLGGGVAPFTIDCTTTQPYLATNIVPGTYNPTFTLNYKTGVEQGPGEVAPFTADGTTDDAYTDSNGVVVTAGASTNELITMYVNRCSFVSGTNPDCSPSR
jgi:hypothetical protein